MKGTILWIAVILTATTVSSETTDNALNEASIAGSYKLEKVLPGEKPPSETSKTLFTFENHGNLEDGLANLNMLHSITLKEAFAKVREMAGRPKCGMFSDVVAVVAKFCPVDSKDTTTAVGTFSSTIKLEEFTRPVNATVRRIDYTLYVKVQAFIDNSKAYERCKLNKTAVKQQYSRIQTLHSLKQPKPDEKHPSSIQLHELIMPNVQYITVVMLRKPRFFRVILTQPPDIHDSNKCHILDKKGSAKISITDGQCTANEQRRIISESLNNSVNVRFEEMESGFSLLMYDSSASKQQLANAEQMNGDGQDPRLVQLVGSSKANIPKKVSMSYAPNGRVFSFDFDNNSSTSESTEQGLVVYFEDVKNERPTSVDEVNSGDKKEVVVKQQPSKLMQKFLSEKCVIDWLATSSSIDLFTSEYLTVPAICDNKRMFCGYLSMKMSRSETLICPALNDNASFELVIKAKTVLDKDKKNSEPKDEIEMKLHRDKLADGTYKHDNELPMEIKSKIKKLLAHVKKSLSSFFTENIWKDSMLSHEILTVRRVLMCDGRSCSSSFRIGLEYNVTHKPGVEPVFNVNPKKLFIQTPDPSSKPQMTKVLTGNRLDEKQEGEQQEQNDKKPRQHTKIMTPWHMLKNVASKMKKTKMPSFTKKSSIDVLKKILFKPSTKNNSEKASDELTRSDKRAKAHNVKLNDARPGAETKTKWLKEVVSKGFDAVRFSVDEKKAVQGDPKQLKSSGVGASLSVAMFMILITAHAWLLLI